MRAAAVAVVCVAAFLYFELAVGFGYYMYLKTIRKADTAEEKEKKQIVKYSVIAGVFFFVTLALILANKAAERK